MLKASGHKTLPFSTSKNGFKKNLSDSEISDMGIFKYRRLYSQLMGSINDTFTLYVLSNRCTRFINNRHYSNRARYSFSTVFVLFPTEIGAIPTYQDNHLEDDRFSPGFLTIGQKYSYAIGSTVILPCKINETGTFVVCFLRFLLSKLFLYPSRLTINYFGRQKYSVRVSVETRQCGADSRKC